MPLLTRLFIKTGFVYFVLALVVGLLMAVQAVWKLAIPSAGLFPVYVHLLVVGWLTMLIIGVAFWMFPKYTREQPRGNEKVGWASYFLLNIGLLLRVISEPTSSMNAPGSLWGVLLAVGALLQWIGGMAFVVNTWWRVKEK